MRHFSTPLKRGIAITAITTGNVRQAILYLDHAVELDSSLVWIYSFRGVAMIQVSNFDCAVTNLTTAIEMGNLHNYLDRSFAYYSIGSYQVALDDIHAFQATGDELSPQGVNLYEEIQAVMGIDE